MDKNRKISLMQYASEVDNIGIRTGTTWDKVQRLLSRREVRAGKKGGRAFSPGLLAKNTTRSSENVDFVSMAVVDADDGVMLDELLPVIGKYEWVAYSSISHTSAHQQFIRRRPEAAMPHDHLKHAQRVQGRQARGAVGR